MNLTDSYPITIEWMPRPGEEPRLEIKEYRDRAAMLNAYADYMRRTGKDVLTVRVGEHHE